MNVIENQFREEPIKIPSPHRQRNEVFDSSGLSDALVEQVNALCHIASIKPVTQNFIESALRIVVAKAIQVHDYDKTFPLDRATRKINLEGMAGFEDWCHDDMEITNCFVTCPRQEAALSYIIEACDDPVPMKKQAAEYCKPVMLSPMEVQMIEAVTLNESSSTSGFEEDAGSLVLNMKSPSFTEDLKRFHSELDNELRLSPVAKENWCGIAAVKDNC